MSVFTTSTSSIHSPPTTSTISNLHEPKITLCMIVGNEEKIIERCLDSVKPLIDFVSISANGSDRTCEIVEDWLERNGVKGKIHHKPWVNFGHNRTESVKLAFESFPESDYLFLMDADMVLQISPSFKKSDLKEDMILVHQVTKERRYPNKRFVKRGIVWRYYLRTHEFISVDIDIYPENFPITKGICQNLVIDDRADGGSKATKLIRDEKWLKEDLLDPDVTRRPDLVSRCHYYLGVTLYSLAGCYLAQGKRSIAKEKYEEACSFYLKRIKDGGVGAEEIYYSYYRCGNCFEQIGHILNLLFLPVNQNGNDGPTVNMEAILSNEEINEARETYFSKAMRYYLKAWQYRPIRAESLYALAKLHGALKEWQLSFLYAMKAKEIPVPMSEGLYVDINVYKYLIDFEISVSAYYVEGKRVFGQVSQRRLEGMITELPEEIAKEVRFNSKFYS
jgi:glycosyltransferase involved in cell wall biosynthesis